MGSCLAVAVVLALSPVVEKAAQSTPVHMRDFAVRDCGLLSLSVCLHVLGVSLDTDEFIRAHPPHEYGNSLHELKALAEAYGLKARCVETTSEALLSSISKHRPAIITVAGQDLFLLTTGLRQDGTTVELIDASVPFRRGITRAEFDEVFGGRAMICAQSGAEGGWGDSSMVRCFRLVSILFIGGGFVAALVLWRQKRRIGNGRRGASDGE